MVPKPHLCAVWICVLMCVIYVPGFTFEANEGDPCLPQATQICVKVQDCPKARDSLKKRIPHGLMRCGFNGFAELVCCPDALPLETNPTQSRGSATIRKSKQACDDVSNEISQEVSWQILGGEEVSAGEFPHMAALGYRSLDNELVFQCGGSLISNRYVLTAAHCVVKQGGNPEIVRLGKVDLLGNSDKLEPVDFGIENITVHPRYQRRTKENDLALIRLNGTIKSSKYIRYACLYNREDDPIGLVVTGWGQVEVNGDTSPTSLQKASLTAVSIEKCNATYLESNQRSLTRTQLCAGSADGKRDTCQGDSGGPIQVQLRENNVMSIVGITSFGSGCGGSIPGVYTRVYSYLDWIENIVWK